MPTNPESQAIPVVIERGWLARILRFVHRNWRPKDIQPPTVDPDFEHLNGVQRSAESFRYSILSLEWWLSPQGRLREWLRLNSKGGATLLIPAIIIVPIVGFILTQLAWCMALLLDLGRNFLVVPVLVVIGAVIVRAGIALFKALFR